MTKEIGPTGKAVKGDNYSPPDVAGVLGIPRAVQKRDDWALYCPRHDIMFALIERSPNGKRICSQGDTWRVQKGGYWEEVK